MIGGRARDDERPEGVEWSGVEWRYCALTKGGGGSSGQKRGSD